jgi:uncharacterized membrane protein
MTAEFIQYGIGRWLHIAFGVMWIGMLYYFNFVQVDALKKAAADTPPTGAGITKHVAPRALFFFRWAAVLTVLMGATLLGGKIDEALFFKEKAYIPIGIGAWLGLIMLFNVWVLIWPNQKKILGIVTATDEEKNKARRTHQHPAVVADVVHDGCVGRHLPHGDVSVTQALQLAAVAVGAARCTGRFSAFHSGNPPRNQ